MDKIQAHKELNQAYSKLLELSALLGLKRFSEDLKKDRHFLSTKVDQS